MTDQSKKLVHFFRKRGGIVRFSAIRKAGFHSDTLIALEKQGSVEKMGRGLYAVSGKQKLSNPDLVVATLKSPKGVVCLISALAFHGATDEIPHEVDLAIPRAVRAQKVDYPPVRYYRFAPKVWKAGIEKRKIDGHVVPIYSLSKTVSDCFRFRNKIGISIARAALKTAVSEKGISPKEIIFFAKLCRVDKIIKPILEAIL